MLDFVLDARNGVQMATVTGVIAIDGIYLVERDSGVVVSEGAHRRGTREDFPLFGRVTQWDDAVFDDSELEQLASEISAFAAELEPLASAVMMAVAGLCRAGSLMAGSRARFLGD